MIAVGRPGLTFYVDALFFCRLVPVAGILGKTTLRAAPVGLAEQLLRTAALTIPKSFERFLRGLDVVRRDPSRAAGERVRPDVAHRDHVVQFHHASVREFVAY